jgi:probable F420-dependent oxidoreductase
MKEKTMQYGFMFPHAIGTDAIAIRDYVQTAEGSGFDYMLTIDHIIGVHPDRFGPSGPPFNYTHETPTHEMFTLFAYLAGVTNRLEFATSVLLLPQRQTALVAKQAAEIDILSGGRLRLVVGIGWNDAEYMSLGQDFHTRGRRLEEQIVVLKRLWTEPLVTYTGRWHHLDRVGINPLPTRPLRLWIGSGAEDRLLQRVARHAEGWMPLLRPGVDAAAALQRLHGFLHQEKRHPASCGLDVRINIGSSAPADWQAAAKRWQALGATHIALTAPLASSTPHQVLTAITEARRVLVAELGEVQ